MRLVVDTNLIISAFLWQGVPGRLIEMAGEQQVQLYTSRVLLDELVESLHYKKFAKQLLKTELSIAQLSAGTSHFVGQKQPLNDLHTSFPTQLA